MLMVQLNYYWFIAYQLPWTDLNVSNLLKSYDTIYIRYKQLLTSFYQTGSLFERLTNTLGPHG